MSYLELALVGSAETFKRLGPEREQDDCREEWTLFKKGVLVILEIHSHSKSIELSKDVPPKNPMRFQKRKQQYSSNYQCYESKI